MELFSSATAPILVPRTAYGLVLLIATLVAGAVSWAIADRLGGDSAALRSVLYATALGAVSTMLPAILRIGPDHWGLAVLAAGMGRILISLGYCFAARQLSPEIPAKPLFMGVASGALLLLVVEAATSIRILGAMERARKHTTSPADDMHRKTA